MQYLKAKSKSKSKLHCHWRSVNSWPDIYYCLTVTVLFLWGALSDGRTCFFLYAAGPCQRSLSRVRVPWISRPYFTVSVLRLSFSSPLTTLRVRVEVFDPASTPILKPESLTLIYPQGGYHRKHVHCIVMDVYCCSLRESTGPLPSNGCPIVERLCCGYMFTEPLPSNRYMLHNIHFKNHVYNLFYLCMNIFKLLKVVQERAFEWILHSCTFEILESLTGNKLNDSKPFE
jgi:hypothetical protein